MPGLSDAPGYQLHSQPRCGAPRHQVGKLPVRAEGGSLQYMQSKRELEICVFSNSYDKEHIVFVRYIVDMLSVQLKHIQAVCTRLYFSD